MFKDYLGRVVAVGDLCVYAANKGVRKGVVTKITEHSSSYNNSSNYSVQLDVEHYGGQFRKQTFSVDDYDPCFWKVTL